jgi:cytochrome c-type biogenesis protein CcmE
MTRKQRRLTLIGVAGSVLAVALGLVLYAMNDTIVFFHAPADVQAKNVQPGTRFASAASSRKARSRGSRRTRRFRRRRCARAPSR